MEAQQRAQQNKLAERQMALAENSFALRNREFDAEQEQLAQNRLAAGQTQEKQQHEAAVQWAVGAVQNLQSARSPEEFSALADSYANDPRARILGVTRDQITPESIAQMIAQARMQAGQAPPAAAPTLSARNVGGFNVLQDSTGKVINSQEPQRAPIRTPSKPDLIQLADGSWAWADPNTREIKPSGEKGPSKNAPGPKETMQLRKEFEAAPAVKDFRTSLPLLVSARNAPDNGYGDLQLIYTAGKVLDPGSVVREGELALTVAAGSPLQRIIGSTRFTAEKGGRLTPETRSQLLGMLNERVLAYRQAYDQERDRYASYAKQLGAESASVIGSHPANAFHKNQNSEQSNDGWSIEEIP